MGGAITAAPALLSSLTLTPTLALAKVAGAFSPVPGGVGPMTIAMLLKNTLNLARHSIGLPRMPLRKIK